MNKSRKGWTKEKLCREQLKNDGFLIVFQSIRTRWATYDYADLFDVVAAKPMMRVLISVKHFGNSNNFLQHQEEIKQFKAKYGLVGEVYQLWLWKSPRWQGRGINKKWHEGEWVRITL